MKATLLFPNREIAEQYYLPLIYTACRTCYSELLPEDIEHTRGHGWPHIYGHFAGVVPGIGTSEQAWEGFSGRLFTLLEAELTPFDDAIGTARELHHHGVPIAVASSSPRARR